MRSEGGEGEGSEEGEGGDEEGEERRDRVWVDEVCESVERREGKRRRRNEEREVTKQDRSKAREAFTVKEKMRERK